MCPVMETTYKVLTELNQIIQILEAQIPANPESPRNAKLEKRLEKELVKYFDKLEKAFPFGKLDGIYNRYVKEGLGSETGDILDPLLATFDDTLKTDIAGQLTETHISGTAEMVDWGKTKAGIPITYEGPPIQGAIDWAGKHSATLVKGMNAETKKRLAHTISRGIETKRGIPGLARDIRREFGDMSRYRSQLIAKTETRQALFQASHDTMVDMGIDGKEWVLGAGGAEGNCEDCIANAGVGIISVDKDFPIPEGDIHPGCTCAIAPARLPEPKVPIAKDEPPVTRPAPAKSKTDSPEMQNLFKDKLKAGKGKFDEDGLKATMKELRSVRLPDSHLATVNRIDVNTTLLKRRAPGSMAACDGSNNIVLASKVAQENITHEIGHAFWNKRVFVPDKISKVKWDIADVFNASAKTGKGFVSSYARTNVDEFFAESYAAFAQNPAAFTKLNPSMGKILKGLWKW